MSAVTAPARGKRKAKVGRVVSDKMDKTIVVSVERLARHRIYKRVIRLTTKFKAHDEHNEAHVGDTVRIEEARPLSATKRWRLVEIVARASDSARQIIVADEAGDRGGHPHGRPSRARAAARHRGRAAAAVRGRTLAAPAAEADATPEEASA